MADATPRDPLVAPSLCDAEGLPGKPRGNRAPGPDGFQGRLAWIAPRSLARLVNPIHVDSVCFARELISYKGGRL
eukprot:7194663-Pyramimonas_sp.AAC.1